MATDQNQDKSILLVDTSITGKLTQSGQVEEVTNEEALANAFSIWLLGSRGETLRSSGGGYLYPHIGKVMTEERGVLIKQAIEDGINNDFEPGLTIVSLSVTGNYERRYWTIRLVAYSKELNLGVNTVDLIRGA